MSILDIAVPTTAIYRFGSPFDRSLGQIPGFYASKSFAGEDASQRSRWRSIVFHGDGTINVNIYIDGVLTLANQSVTMTDVPTQLRVINFPRGWSTGYKMRYEYSISSGYCRFVEIYYETMNSDVN